MHIGQSKIAPRVPIRQLLVIDAQKMKHRRMQIVNVNLVLYRSKSKVVRRFVNWYAFNCKIDMILILLYRLNPS